MQLRFPLTRAPPTASHALQHKLCSLAVIKEFPNLSWDVIWWLFPPDLVSLQDSSPLLPYKSRRGALLVFFLLVVQLKQCKLTFRVLTPPLVWFLQGNQEATNPPEAMAQPYTPAQYPPPPQNGIPAEFAAPHPLPTQDYTGQSRVPEHAMTLYTPTQTHSEPAGTDNSTPTITATTTAPVSVLHHLQALSAAHCQKVKLFQYFTSVFVVYIGLIRTNCALYYIVIDA